MLKFVDTLHKNTSASTAVETAILMPILLFFLFGVIEVSRYYFSSHELFKLGDKVSRDIIIRGTDEVFEEWPTFLNKNKNFLNFDDLSFTRKSYQNYGESEIGFSLNYNFQFILPLIGDGGSVIHYDRAVPLTGF